MLGDNFAIGLVQQACSHDQLANQKKAAELVRIAAAKGAQIVCLQELFSSTYFCTEEVNSNFALAEKSSGKIVTKFQDLARELNIVIVVPFFEERASGIYHNSAAVVDADGTMLGVYRKMHIPDDPLYYEKYYFTPGDTYEGTGGFRVFITKYATIGVLICWDQWYPEAARITSLLGAEVLFYPTAIGWHPKEKNEVGATQVDAWRTIQRSHAIANGIYVAAVNRVWLESTPGTDGLEFFGHSFICSPNGKIIAEAGLEDNAVIIAKCSRHDIKDFRCNWPFFRDRRIDAYKPILRRYIDD